MDAVIVFSNGSLGDFLIALVWSETLRAAARAARAVVVIPKEDVTTLRALAAPYGAVEVLSLTRRTFAARCGYLVRLGRGTAVAATFPTTGTIPLRIKIMMRLLTLRHGSRCGGFADAGVGWLRDCTVPYDASDPLPVLLERLAAVLGYPSRFEPRLRAPALGWEGLARRARLQAPYIVVHPCASTPQRSLPPRRWAVLLDALCAHYPALSIVCTGSAADRAFIGRIRALMRAEAAVRDAAGEFTLTELAALLAHASVYLGVDTGVSHLAALLRVPSVVVGNRSNPAWLPAYNSRGVVLASALRCTCRGNKRGDCFDTIEGQRYYRCMLDVPDQDILAALDGRLRP